jgi:hypothetical protein
MSESALGLSLGDVVNVTVSITPGQAASGGGGGGGATDSVSIVSPPSTATTSQALSLGGAVDPEGAAVEVQFGTSNTVAPTGSWTTATVTEGSWSATLNAPGSTGTFYIWAQQTSDPTVQAVSPAVTVSAPSNTVSIISPPSSLTEAQSVSLSGAVAPNGTAVQAQFGTSNTVAPTGSWTTATVSSGSWSATITAPGSTGTFYIWAQQTSDPTVQAVSPAVTVSAPSAPAIANNIGGLTWGVSLPTTDTYPHYSGTTNSIACTFSFSGTPSGSAAPQLFWVQSPVSSIPTANGTTIIDTAVTNPIVGALINSGALDAYINPPPTAGTWYLTGWYNATQGFNTTAFIVT